SSSGPDAVDPDFPDERAGVENEEGGLLDRFMNEIEDPNNDGSTDDSFMNNFLPMLGIPRKITELKQGLEGFIDEFEEKFLAPTNELLGPIPNPLQPLI